MSPIHACSECRRRVTDEDILSGDAVVEGDRIVCGACLIGMDTMNDDVDRTLVVARDAYEEPADGSVVEWHDDGGKRPVMRMSRSSARLKRGERRDRGSRKSKGSSRRSGRAARASAGGGGFFKFLLVLILLGGAGYGGWYYYTNYYLPGTQDKQTAAGGTDTTGTADTNESTDTATVADATDTDDPADAATPDAPADDGEDAPVKDPEAESVAAFESAMHFRHQNMMRTEEIVERLQQVVDEHAGRQGARMAEAMLAYERANQMADKDPSGILATIQRYEDVARKYPGFRGGQLAESRAKSFTETLETNARRELKTVRMGVKQDRHSGHYDVAIGRLRRLMQQYPSPSIKPEVDQMIADLEEAIAQSHREKLEKAVEVQHAVDFNMDIRANWIGGMLERDNVPPDGKQAVRAARVDKFVMGIKDRERGYFELAPSSMLCFDYFASETVPVEIELKVMRADRSIGRFGATFDSVEMGDWKKARMLVAAFTHTETEAPLAPGDTIIGYGFRLSEQPEDREYRLIIDNLTVAKGGLPDAFKR